MTFYHGEMNTMTMQLHNDGLANGEINNDSLYPMTTIDQQTLIDGLNHDLAGWSEQS